MEISLTKQHKSRNMQLVVVFLLCIASVAVLGADTRRRSTPFLRRPKLPPPPKHPKASGRVEELWITQPLDQFDPSNTNTWQQRYFANRDFYTVGGPVFVFIVGEGEADPAWIQGGHTVEMAEQNNGLLFFLEHRYYGQSHPTPDASTENLRYLNSTQALEDLANFIRQQKASDPALADVPWIVVGGSYAGALSAWARIRYPDLIYGAISSSNAVYSTVSYPEYNEAVNMSLYSRDPQCVEDIQAAVAEMDSLLLTSDGVTRLNEIFKICEPLDFSDPLDVSSLYINLIFVYGLAAQYNYSFSDAIGSACNVTTDPTYGSTPIERIATLTLGGLDCLDVKATNILAYFSQDQWGELALAEGMRQWTYQTCTSVGAFQTTDNTDRQPFGNKVNLAWFLYWCSAYGPEFDQNRLEAGVAFTNELYGGRNPETNVTNVVLVSSGADPWRFLAIEQEIDSQYPIIYIPGQAHCSDLYAKSPNDEPQLTEAKLKIESIVAEWVNQ